MELTVLRAQLLVLNYASPEFHVWVVYADGVTGSGASYTMAILHRVHAAPQHVRALQHSARLNPPNSTFNDLKHFSRI